MSKYFKRFGKNGNGHDFVVGDVHGCFDLLHRLLVVAGFDKRKDRVFSVGDLVDRGPSSHAAVAWLGYPWFHAVRGNHEQMAIEAGAGLCDMNLHCINGGVWFYGLCEADRRRTCKAFSEMPYAIEVATDNGAIGLVHAEVPGDDWEFFRESLIASEAEMPANFEHLERFALWGRDVIRGRSGFAGVENISRVYVGHTPVKEWQAIGNVHYIDTGACFGKKMTLVRISDGEVFELAAS